MPLTFIAAEYDRTAIGSFCNGNRLGLHNVAPAPGENPRCRCSSCLPFVRWRSLWSRAPLRLAEQPVVWSCRRTTRGCRHAVIARGYLHCSACRFGPIRPLAVGVDNGGLAPDRRRCGDSCLYYCCFAPRFI